MIKCKPGKGIGGSFGDGTLVARRFYLIVALFAAIILGLLSMDRFEAYVLDAARAYVGGEGLWSKGQKDASYHLARYADSHDPADYRRFRESLAAPLGDHEARLALQAQPPQLERARRGLLAGGNHPDDIDSMIDLFLDFGDMGEMKQAIAIWTQADQRIMSLQRLGERLHGEIATGASDSERIDTLLARMDRLNSDVSILENRFSATLGRAARNIADLTGSAMITATLLLLTAAILFSRRLVADMRRTEAALVNSEARFRHVVESNMVGITFWHQDGRLFDANDAFLEIIGYNRDELERQEIDWQELTPDEFHKKDEQALQEIARNGRCSPYEKELRHRDGHRLAVYIAAACFDHSEKSGVCFVLDISERKRAEQQQRIAASVFQSVQEGIMVTDPDGTITAVNPSFSDITGYASAEAEGRNPSLLISGKHPPEFFGQMWRQLREKGCWKGEIYNRRKNGDVYPEWLTISAIRDVNGDISAYVGVFNDVTEQHQMQEQLRQSQKMEAIGTLVGGIAHDFNNTLAAVEGNLFMAKQQCNDNPGLTDRLEKIESLTGHSAGMVRQLLAFARKGIMRMKAFDLNEFLRRQTSLVTTILPENIDFDMQLCDEKLTITGDTGQLQQILLNLLNNAREAVADCVAPRIECRLAPCHPDAALQRRHPHLAGRRLARLTIADNGSGMHERELEHIFEPFYTTREVGRGTGLGLAMVYGTVQRHDGAIEVSSAPGRGAALHIYLPLSDTPEETTAGAQPIRHDAASSPGAVPATILLVDDDDAMRHSTAEALTSLGYTVLTAENGSEGLARLEGAAKQIELLITDVVMPDMGGYALAERVRAVHPELPLLFITGYDPAQSPVPEALADHSTLLVKPFRIDVLADAVRQLLTSSRPA